MGIGCRIKEARERLGLTQTELGAKVGVTGSAITNYEKNTSHPKEQVIYKLMEVLNVDANYLFQDVTDIKRKGNDITEKEYEHIKKYRLLDDFGKETVNIVMERESSRVSELKQKSEHIVSLEKKIPDENISSRIITYYHKLASAGKGEYLFPDIPTDTISVKDDKISRNADFVIGVNGDSMEPDFYDGEKVFVKKTGEMDIGEVGIFVQGNDCFIKELGSGCLISRNKKYPDIIPSDDIELVGKVIGKAEVI